MTEHHRDTAEGISTETSSIPVVASSATGIQRALTPEELRAVAALPADSALLIASAGINEGARFLLDQDVVTVGRHPRADVFLDDVTVSRRHAQFTRKGGRFVLADNNSLNGTYVNHDRIDELVLENGMELQIGKFRLTFISSPNA